MYGSTMPVVFLPVHQREKDEQACAGMVEGFHGIYRGAFSG